VEDRIENEASPEGRDGSCPELLRKSVAGNNSRHKKRAD